MPVRIQLKRTKGWKMPAGAKKVDRTSIFGNPFRSSYDRDPAPPERVVVWHRWWLTREGPKPPDYPAWAECDRLDNLRADVLTRLPELRGKDLGCWCGPADSCHAAVLLELANRPEEPS